MKQFLHLNPNFFYLGYFSKENMDTNAETVSYNYFYNFTNRNLMTQEYY